MRYLYGDSAAFPLQYNFLATLEAFVSSAARAAQLDAEARAIQEATGDAVVVRAKALAALETFHQSIVRSVQEHATQTTDPQVLDYARQVVDHASRIVEDSKHAAMAAAERDQASARVEVDRRKTEIRHALEQFLTAGRIPILESRVSMTLVDGQNQLSAIFTHPESLVTSFVLSAASLPAWQTPRKVADFATGVDLMVGVKKSMFKRTVQPEAVHLDDYIVSGFDVHDDAAEIRLRRKLSDAHDTFVFRMARDGEDLLAEVERPGEIESEAPATIDAADRRQLERLWQLLRAGAADALVHKERLLTAELEEQNLFELAGGPVSFIERIVRIIAPTVAEISRRSSSPNELSLKMEADGGRREEIYLKKADLFAKLEVLGERERMLFAPLALTRDKWLSGSSLQSVG